MRFRSVTVAIFLIYRFSSFRIIPWVHCSNFLLIGFIALVSGFILRSSADFWTLNDGLRRYLLDGQEFVRMFFSCYFDWEKQWRVMISKYLLDFISAVNCRCLFLWFLFVDFVLSFKCLILLLVWRVQLKVSRRRAYFNVICESLDSNRELGLMDWRCIWLLSWFLLGLELSFYRLFALFYWVLFPFIHVVVMFLEDYPFF